MLCAICREACRRRRCNDFAHARVGSGGVPSSRGNDSVTSRGRVWCSDTCQAQLRDAFRSTFSRVETAFLDIGGRHLDDRFSRRFGLVDLRTKSPLRSIVYYYSTSRQPLAVSIFLGRIFVLQSTRPSRRRKIVTRFRGDLT